MIAGAATQAAIDDLVQTEMGRFQQTTGDNQDLVTFLSVTMIGVTVFACLVPLALSQTLVRRIPRFGSTDEPILDQKILGWTERPSAVGR